MFYLKSKQGRHEKRLAIKSGSFTSWCLQKKPKAINQVLFLELWRSLVDLLLVSIVAESVGRLCWLGFNCLCGSLSPSLLILNLEATLLLLLLLLLHNDEL